MHPIAIVGLDITKSVLQVLTADADGEIVVCRPLKRVQVVDRRRSGTPRFPAQVHKTV